MFATFYVPTKLPSRHINIKIIHMNQLNFKGIVRSTSPQNNSDGNCDEIINLRLHEGSWWAVGKKKPIVEGIDYERVYVHRYGAFENFIGLKDGKVFWFASRKGDNVKSENQEICSISGDVDFNQLNNILLVRDGVGIAKAIFRDNKYSVSLVKLPDAPALDVKIDVITKYSEKVDLSYTKSNQIETDSIKGALYGLIKQCEYDSFYEGHVFLTATYQLFDGSETKPTPPLLVELGKYDKGAIKREELSWGSAQNPVSVRSGRFWAEIPVGQLNLKVNNTLGEEFKETITKINVYASPVYSYYNSDAVNLEGAAVVGSDGLPSSMVGERKLKSQEIEKSLFYQVLSIDVKDQSDEYKVISLDDVTTNKILRVDASGWMNTTGKMFSYNNRLHLFNTKQKFVDDVNLTTCLEGRYKTVAISGVVEGDPVYNYDFTNTRTLTGIFYLKMEQEDARVVDDFRVELQSHALDILTGLTTYKVRLPRFLAFPDSRAYKVELYDGNSFVKTLDLTPSSTYNYSYVYFNVTSEKVNRPSTLSEDVGTRANPNVPVTKDDSIVEYTNAPASVRPDFNSSPAIEDTMNLIASEVMNPYYFPPEHSYLMPGEIINIAVNTEQISTSQVGQFPLYVFTAQGIYALQVGDGKVLYSNVIPISAEVAVKGSEVLQTKYGIIFVTDKGLKLISGQQVVDFSEAVDGKPDEAIRSSKEYKFAVGDEKICNVSPYLSIVPFSDYVGKAVMGYDITEDEVIISNPAYKYSYVFSLKTKTWHKITDVFSDFNQYLGLQSYEAGAVAAKATIFIRTSVVSGNLTKFTKAVSLPEIVFEPGMLTVSIGIMGSRSELFSCSVDEATDIMQLLEEEVSIPELQFKILADESKVYTNMPFTNLIFEHDMFPEAQFYPFVAEERELPLTPVGVGETFSVKLAGRTFSHVTDGTETPAKVAMMIAVWMKKLDLGYDILLENGDLNIIAQPGAEGNKIELICTSSPHVVFISSGFQGGADLSVKNRVCDIRKEMPEDRKIFVQTRPILLGTNGFKKLPNVLFRGEFCPVDGKQHRIYIFGSNDLKNYVCTSSGAFGYRRVNVRLRGSYGSYRYYVIMMEGDVMPGHTIVQMETDEQLKLGNRLR